MYPEILQMICNPICKVEKLDGGLGVLYMYKNGHYICSKNNFNHYIGTIGTDTFYNQHYHLHSDDLENHTTLFEIITFKNPFTINYTVKDLIFPIAVINNISAKSDFIKLGKLNKIDLKDTVNEGFV